MFLSKKKLLGVECRLSWKQSVFYQMIWDLTERKEEGMKASTILYSLYYLHMAYLHVIILCPASEREREKWGSNTLENFHALQPHHHDNSLIQYKYILRVFISV